MKRLMLVVLAGIIYMIVLTSCNEHIACPTYVGARKVNYNPHQHDNYYTLNNKKK